MASHNLKQGRMHTVTKLIQYLYPLEVTSSDQVFKQETDCKLPDEVVLSGAIPVSHSHPREVCGRHGSHGRIYLYSVKFRINALLSSYDVICSLWRLLPAIESQVKSKLTTTNYLSPWKVCVPQIDSDSSEISRASMSNLSSLGQSTSCSIVADNMFNLAHVKIVHMLIVLLSLLCT